MTNGQAWRLRVRVPPGFDGEGTVLGAGFVVDRGVGITCAHVIDGLDCCWVDVPGVPGMRYECRVRKVDPDWLPSSDRWLDIAEITLPEELPSAPLGSAEPPPTGAVLDALGFPERYGRDDDQGQRTQVWVVGGDGTGKLVQVDGLLGAHGQIQPGYSGGAVMDLKSNRVVGMVVSNDQLRPLPAPPGQEPVSSPQADPRAGLPPHLAKGPGMAPGRWQETRASEEARGKFTLANQAYERHLKSQPDLLRIAWIIPLSTIAEVWSPLARLLPRSIQVDPEFRRAVTELEFGSYPQAFQRLNALVTVYPYEPDLHYYRVLAGLGGVRPGAYTLPMIEAVEKLLEGALRLDSKAAHVQVVWALVKEDYYVLRGIPGGDYGLDRLRSAVAGIEDKYADEILRHVPADGCLTYWNLRNKRGHL